MTIDAHRPADPAAPAHAGVSPLFRLAQALFEGAALLVALVAAERLFLGRGAYAALDVHPFWAPVLLVTLQYGLYGGALTACFAALMLDWPIRAPGQDIVDYYFEAVRLPLQWLLAALALGAFRSGQIRAEDARETEILRLVAMNDRLAQEIARLDAELSDFELAVATGSAPASGEARQAGEAGSDAGVPADAPAGPVGDARVARDPAAATRHRSAASDAGERLSA